MARLLLFLFLQWLKESALMNTEVPVKSETQFTRLVLSHLRRHAGGDQVPRRSEREEALKRKAALLPSE